jgi:hypothetical protein
MKRSAARVSKFGPPHRIRRHCLAKGNRRRLHIAPAIFADRRTVVALEGDAQSLQFVASVAVEAMRRSYFVQFDDPVVGNAGGLVQTVHVLGHDRRGCAAADQLGDGAVTLVRGRSTKGARV